MLICLIRGISQHEGWSEVDLLVKSVSLSNTWCWRHGHTLIVPKSFSKSTHGPTGSPDMEVCRFSWQNIPTRLQQEAASSKALTQENTCFFERFKVCFNYKCSLLNKYNRRWDIYNLFFINQLFKDNSPNVNFWGSFSLNLLLHFLLLFFFLKHFFYKNIFYLWESSL